MAPTETQSPPPMAYANGVERRRTILEAATKLFTSRGYRAISIREIAAASGTTHSTVLHHFSSKEDLLRAVLAQRDEDVAARIEAQDARHVPEALIGATRRNSSERGLIASFVSAAAEATSVDHPAHEHFRDRYAGARRAVNGMLERARVEGQLNAELNADSAAALLLAIQDGLQIQWLLDPEAVDIVELTEVFMRLMFTWRPSEDDQHISL